MRVIAHVDMDAFFASVEQRDHPQYQSKPVIVGADPKEGRGRGVVAACSYEARQFGIHSAMPISVAFRRCPQAVFLPCDFHRYQKASDEIFSILYDFTPDIEPVSIDEAFLDLSGSYHFYETPLKTGEKIRERIKSQTRLTASIGIAPNKMVAKIASAFCKPDGLLEILPENVLSFLKPLPVSKLWGVGVETEKILHQLGVFTIGQLGEQSVELLQSHLGSSGKDLHDLAQGKDDGAVAVSEETKSVSHEHTFDKDTNNQEQLLAALSTLVEKVSRRMRQYGLKGKTLTFKVRLSDFKTYSRSFTFDERVNFFEPIYNAARCLLREFINWHQKIRLLGVRMTHFEGSYFQESLFQNQDDEKKEKIHAALDRIKDKFGENIISRGQSRWTH
jgi:DNA polymerase IV